MRKHSKILFVLPAITVGIPAAASLAILWLWNNLMPDICGFETISYVQAAGLFFLGQLLTAGFIIGCFLTGGLLHTFRAHRHNLPNHWHEMSAQERHEFFHRRKQWFEMMHKTEIGKEDESQ